MVPYTIDFLCSLNVTDLMLAVFFLRATLYNQMCNLIETTNIKSMGIFENAKQYCTYDYYRKNYEIFLLLKVKTIYFLNITYLRESVARVECK